MTKRVLILCTGNSARSQMAEGILRSLGGGRLEVFSAGTKPSTVRPEAIAVMAELGIDISGHRSKHVQEFDGRHFDYVITVCDNANESCPVFPGDTRRIHWSFPDPAAVEGGETQRLAAFRRVRDSLAETLRNFVATAIQEGPMDAPSSKVTEFRQRVERDWAGDDTAAAWQKHYPQMKEQLAPVTAALVEAAAPRPGMSILDLASGTGEPSLSLARRVAPGGRVTATDLSSGMLAALNANAQAEGVTNIDTKVVDAHQLPFPDGTFDLVTSRFGVMFFAETARALAEIKRVLKPRGRIAFMVWGVPAPGTSFGLATPYVRRLAVKPDPDGPGPLRFAEPGKLARLVEAAGFREVGEESLSPETPFRGSPEQMLAAMMEFAAPFRNAAATLSDDHKRAAEQEVYGNLRPLYDGTVTRITAPVLIVTAVS